MNNEILIPRIAKEQNITNNQVQAVASLLSEGHMIPFIERYRKEATGSLDEVAVKNYFGLQENGKCQLKSDSLMME